MDVTIEVRDYAPESVVPPTMNQIHVWRASLLVDDNTLVQLRKVLSSEEIDRAERYYRPEDRRRFIGSHGILRQILAGCQPECRAKDLQFTVGPNGKPALATRRDGKGLQFNLAHSGDWMVAAVGNDVDVGVDVEVCHSGLDVMTLADTVMSSAERALLETTLPAERLACFYRCWVRKEACLKACGLGITTLLQKIDVLSLDTVNVPGFSKAHCHLFDLDVGPGLAAALAVMPAKATGL